VAELRKRTDQLPDDYWVVLVGDMITEEALPTYMAMLNTLDGVRDETGASPTPWGRCARMRTPHAPTIHQASLLHSLQTCLSSSNAYSSIAHFCILHVSRVRCRLHMSPAGSNQRHVE
jgi:hypothetical protein